MVLHYSISFEGDPFKYHGEVEYPLNIYQNCEPYVESMTAFVKSALTKSIKKWGFTAEDMTSVEFYFFKGSEEVVFFQWEKSVEVEKINK